MRASALLVYIFRLSNAVVEAVIQNSKPISNLLPGLLAKPFKRGFRIAEEIQAVRDVEASLTGNTAPPYPTKVCAAPEKSLARWLCAPVLWSVLQRMVFIIMFCRFFL